MTIHWTDSATRFARYGDQMVGLPILEQETIQLGKGDGATLAVTARGRDLVVQRVVVAPEMITRTVPDPEWAAISIALSWTGDRIFNGTLVRPHDLFMSASPNGYETSGKGRDIVTLGIRQDRLRFACSALLGLASEEIQLCNLALNMGSKIEGPLHSLLTNALSSALAAKTKNFTPIQPELENYIIDVIARTIAPQLAMDTHSTPPEGSPREVVHMALSAFVDLEHPPSISDLCSAAAVGETHLYECFIEVFNASPARFIRMRRLSEARRRLLDRDAPPRSVKEVAMELGFRESGRFAHYYKATFGEHPSLTLKRVQSSSTSSQYEVQSQ